jgi:hypothetical protein
MSSPIVRPGRSLRGGYEMRGNDGRVTQRYTHNFTVEWPEDEPIPVIDEVLQLPGLPIVKYSCYSPRPGWLIPYCICRSKNALPRDTTMRLWDVTCEFSSESDQEQQPQQDNQDPFSLAPIIDYFCEVIEIAGSHDRSTPPKLLANPIGQPYADPILIPTPCRGVKVTRYVPSYDDSTLEYWMHTLNKTTWRNEPADTWWVKNITGSKTKWGTFEIGMLTWEILGNKTEYTDENGVKHRVGWMETRERIGSLVRNAAGDLEVPRTKPNVGFMRIEQAFIDKTGKPIPEGNPKQFDIFRKYLRREFDQILPA